MRNRRQSDSHNRIGLIVVYSVVALVLYSMTVSTILLARGGITPPKFFEDIIDRGMIALIALIAMPAKDKDGGETRIVNDETDPVPVERVKDK
jgi:hypothetical protein